MCVETQCTTNGSAKHGVDFYERDSELADSVVGYLIAGLQEHGVAVLIATQPHRELIESGLREAGIDVEQRVTERDLVMLDARETLERFMCAGRLDRSRFREVVGSVIERAGDRGRPVRAFGEMVALLWEAGDVLQAIELEKLWNELGRELEFSLLCAYHSDSVKEPHQAQQLHEICEQHSAVYSAPLGAGGEPQLRVLMPPELKSSRVARELVVKSLVRWGREGGLLQDAQLVVSELASNAIVHARSAFTLIVAADGSGIHISVQDANRGEPKVASAGLTETSGRGLRLVTAVAAEWGVERSTPGKTVWARLEEQPA